MKNSSKIIAITILGSFISGMAYAQSYQKVESSIQTPAPEKKNVYSYYGNEAAAYAYGYAYNLPNDGNWRFIEERCYNSSKGETCIQGHWIRKRGNECEEVSSHTVKTGNYTKIIPQGKVSTCRK